MSRAPATQGRHPRWIGATAGIVLVIGLAYLALYPFTLGWAAPAYLRAGQLHTLAFLLSLAPLAWLSAALPDRGGRWAARVLLITSALAIGLNLLQLMQRREITVPAGIIGYVLVYLLNVTAVNCVFPAHQWHLRTLLRRFSEIIIVMCVAYAGLQFALPRLIPGWAWSAGLTMASFRLVSTIGLITAAAVIVHRYFLAGGRAVWWGAIGLGGMLITDVLLLGMTALIERGGSERLMASASPVWVIQHGCWLLALSALAREPLRWRDEPSVQLPPSLGVWVRSARQGVAIVVLGLIVSQQPDGTLWIWFIVALIAREIIVAYERELAAQRQARSQRELEHASRRIQHLMALRTAHVKGATHDLSHGIMTFYAITEQLLRELERHQMPATQVEMYRRQARAGIALNKAIVQDLHDTALLEQDALRLDRRAVDLREVVTGVAQQMRARFDRQECRLALDVLDTPQWVAIDRPRIERVLLNVLVNALNAIDHDRGLVTIQLAATQPPTVLIEDNGCGIDAAHLLVIADQFAAIDQGIIPTSAGIGLNLCKRLVDAHGGRFVITSTADVGTTIRIVLPPADPASIPAHAPTHIAHLV